MDIQINSTKISKAFSSSKFIFENIDLNLVSGDCIAITGHNGSGKSTLLKILSGILKQTKGKVEYFESGKKINKDEFKVIYGFVAPYLNLYEEFHPVEHLKIFSKIKDIDFDTEYYKELLHRFNLFEARRKPIRDFSSGMKQRMKFIMSLQHRPSVLFLDEPTSNLDEEGIKTVNEIVQEFKKDNKLIIMATNESREKALCNKFYSLENDK
jgi:ABC-type multidrug transport system ATPase subunit